MGKRLHVAQTERKPVPAPAAPTTLNIDLLRYVARDITHAKATLEPHLFHTAVHLIQNERTAVPPRHTRADARRWQAMRESATATIQAAKLERAQLETTRAAQPIVASASLETSAATARAVSRQATARTQYWHAQIQRFGIQSYARHYEDHSDFQTRSAQVQPNGEALHPVLLEALEAHFQQKLPAIQIHSDTSAASRAREVGALAFTSGAGIHFGAGQYQPFTTDGFKLLVHETAHVLQQASGIVPDGVDTDPSLESAAQLEASRVTNTPSLNAPTKPSVSSQPVQSQQPSSLPFETAGQWAAYLLNTLKHHSVPRERFAVVAEIYSSIPVDQQGKARALMLGKLNPNSSEHQRLEASLIVTPSASVVKSSGSSTSQGKPRQAGDMNFFTYLNPPERDLVLPNYRAFPVSSGDVKASPILETVAPIPSRPSAGTARAPRQPFRATHATSRSIQRQQNPGNEEPIGKMAFVREAGLNLRDKPATTGKGIPLEFGTRVFVISKAVGGWFKVLVSGSKLGYVRAASVHGLKTEHQAMLRKDPGLRLVRVKSGQSGWNLVKTMYGIKGNEGGKDQGIYHFLNAIRSVNNPAMFKIVMQGNAAQQTAGAVKNWAGEAWGAGFDADNVQLQQGDLWIPSFMVAAKMDVGSGTMGGEASRLYKKVDQKIQDFKRACQLSSQFIPKAVGDQVGKSAEGLVTGLIDFAIKAAGIIAVSTAVGGLVGAFAGGAGAAPGAALGFEIGLQIVELYGLTLLAQWLGQSLIGIGSAFGSFIGQVWNANGDQNKLKIAAVTLANALAKLIGFLLEALAAFIIAKGFKVLAKTKFAKTVGEKPFAKWASQRVANQVTRRNTAINNTRNAIRDAIDTRNGVRRRVGQPVKPIEMTYDYALNKAAYIAKIVSKYGMNLKGVLSKVKVIIDSGISAEGITKYAEKGAIIRISENLVRSGNEAAIANTIAHELSHAREFQQAWKAGYKTLAAAEKSGIIKDHGNSGSVGNRTPYGSGNALEDYINGGR